MPKRINAIPVIAQQPSSDDFSPMDGATNGTRRITEANRAAWIGSTRAFAGYLWSDGVTTNRLQIQTPGARGNLAGAPVASWVGWVDVPTANPVNDAIIACIQNGIGYPWAAGNSLAIFIGPFGKLEVGQWAASGSRNWVWINTFRPTYSGQRIWLEVRITAGTGNPVIRINGVDVSANFTSGNGGTPPPWLDSGLATTSYLTGYVWPSGIAPLGRWLSAHLTDAESEAWRITGRPPVWVALGGSQLDIKPTSGAFAYWFGTGSVVSSTATQAVLAAGANGLAVRNPALTITPQASARVRINLTISGLTGSVNAQLSTFSVSVASAVLTADGTYDVELTTSTAGQGNIVLSATSTTQVTITINSVRLLGALSEPAVQPIAVLDDSTMLGGNQARLVGMTPICERGDWRIVTPTATNGNQQLLGGAVFAEPQRHRIDSWVVNNTGSATRTVSLGQSSGATTYVNAASCPVGRTEITLATRFPASGQPNLWANSNGTDTLVHTITGHRVGA